MYYVSPQKYDD